MPMLYGTHLWEERSSPLGIPPLAGGWAPAQRGGALASTLARHCPLLDAPRWPGGGPPRSGEGRWLLLHPRVPFQGCPPLAGGSFTLISLGSDPPLGCSLLAGIIALPMQEPGSA